MSSQPMPSTAAVAEHPHTWDEVHCAGCNEPLGTVASFDAGRAAEALYCRRCLRWCELKCIRCGKSLGSTPAPNRGPILCCSSCAKTDATAREQRERLEAVGQEPRAAEIVELARNTEADPW